MAVTRQRAVVVAIALTCVLAGAAWFALPPWRPWGFGTDLRGATRDEVRNRLGEPEAYSTPERWVYRRAAHLGEFRVDFDASGRVEYWSNDL